MQIGRLSAFIISLSLIGCGSGKKEEIGVEAKLIAPDGFVCTSTPSTAYGIGYVYRIDADQVHWAVDYLTNAVSPQDSGIALPAYYAKLSVNGGISASLLKAINPIAGASGEIAAGSESESIVSFSGTKLSYIFDKQEPALQAAVYQALKGIDPKKDSNYFFVRDVISASGAKIEISDKDVFELNGKAKIKEIVDAAGSFKFNDDDKIALTGDFDEPLNVCYRVVRLDLSPEAFARASSIGSDPYTSNSVITNELATSNQSVKILSATLE